MKRDRGILIIGLCFILIVFLVGVLVRGTTRGIGLPMSVFSINKSNLKNENKYNADLDGIDNIKFDVTVDNILIEESDDNDIRIIEKSNYKLEESEKLEINQHGSSLQIVRNDNKNLSGRSNINRRLEIYLPKDYQGSLVLENDVGNIMINSELNIDKLYTKQKVGDLRLKSKIECNTFSIENTTGDVLIQTTTGDIDLLVNRYSSFILDSKYNIGELDTNIELDKASTSKKSLSGNYGYNPQNILKVKANIGDINISVKYI